MPTLEAAIGADLGPNVDTIADAIAASSDRRSVVRAAVWSVPLVAIATAAPAFAASPPTCAFCPTATNQCLLDGLGTCVCGAGLVCVGTGPLGLTNVCVGTSLLLASCGAGSCHGVCLAAGGALVAALNTFVTSITALATANVLCANHAVTATPVPTNVCVSPLSNTFGSLCLITSGSGALGTSLATIIGTLTSSLTALGVALSNPCPVGTTCKSIVTFDIGGGLACLGSQATGTLGYCACP